MDPATLAMIAKVGVPVVGKLLGSIFGGGGKKEQPQQSGLLQALLGIAGQNIGGGDPNISSLLSGLAGTQLGQEGQKNDLLSLLTAAFGGGLGQQRAGGQQSSLAGLLGSRAGLANRNPLG